MAPEFLATMMLCHEYVNPFAKAIAVLNDRVVAVCWFSAVMPNAHSHRPATGTSRAPKLAVRQPRLSTRASRSVRMVAATVPASSPHVHALTM